MRTLLALLAAAFIAAHLPFLPASLADLASINYAFAIRDFDVTRQQPHPPGAPLYVGAARGLTAALHRAGDPQNVPHALAGVSLLGGALAMLAVFWLARVLLQSTRRAVGAAVITVAAPLVWVSASRPMPDLPAIAMALGAQALVARGWLGRSAPHVVAGAVIGGLSAGFDARAAVLTLPLLVAALFAARISAPARLLAMLGWIAGVLAWLAPLAIDTGPGNLAGLTAGAWRSALGGAESLVNNMSARQLVDILQATFVEPFGSPLLAAVVLGMAAIGAAIAAFRERHVLLVLALGFGPYLAIQLLLHDSAMSTPALPLVPALALLSVIPLDYVSSRAVLPFAAGVAAGGLFVALPALAEFSRADSPGFAVIRDLHRMPRANDTVLAMHHRIESDLRRHRAWEPIPPMRTLPSTEDYEWLELVTLWQEGYEGAIWFLADPRRTDLRLIDPQRRRLLRQYGWPDRDMPFISGIRPNRIDWYLIQRPGWFLGRGWALSPEIGGLTARERASDGSGRALAWVRRRDIASTMLLGGRHAGSEADPLVTVRVRIDGRQIDEWSIRPGPFVFMRPVLPEEIAGEGTYARLEIETSWTGSGPAPISLEQFDFQAIDGTVVAYDDGWFEPEYSQRSGATWRSTSQSSTLWLFNPGRELTLAISGEDTNRTLGGGAELAVYVGEQELATFTVDGNFTRTVTIPAEPLSVARGRITLRTDGDRRFRIFDVSVY